MKSPLPDFATFGEIPKQQGKDLLVKPIISWLMRDQHMPYLHIFNALMFILIVMIG